MLENQCRESPLRGVNGLTVEWPRHNCSMEQSPPADPNSGGTPLTVSQPPYVSSLLSCTTTPRSPEPMANRTQKHQAISKYHWNHHWCTLMPLWSPPLLISLSKVHTGHIQGCHSTDPRSCCSKLLTVWAWGNELWRLGAEPPIRPPFPPHDQSQNGWKVTLLPLHSGRDKGGLQP